MSLQTEGNGDAVTLSEYIKEFNDYYDRLVTTINSTKELEENLKAAKEELDTAQKDLDDVTQRLKDLRAEKKAGVLDSKKRLAETAATNLKTAKDVAEKANADYEASKKAMDEAQANVDAAKQEVAGKNTALGQTKAAYKELAGKELESYDADTAKKHYDEATAGLDSCR